MRKIGKRITPLAKPVKYAVSVPGSKSFVNRALICAALRLGKTTLHNLNYCDDVEYLIGALKKLGVRIVKQSNTVVVYGTGGKFTTPTRPLFLGNAGTAIRFLLPFVPAGTIVTGNAAMQQRPIKPLVDALRELGYTIEAPTGCPPITVIDTTISKRSVTIDGSLSSQYISALVLLQSTLAKPFQLKITGVKSSKPYISMTQSVVRHFQKNNQYTVPADASSATYWWTLAAITGSKITVENIDQNIPQADLQFLHALQRMGCTVIDTAVIGPQTLKPITINMRDFPDSVMSLAIVAACTPGKTVITNIEHLKVKETDRLALLVKNLKTLGVKVTATESQITIFGEPKKLRSGKIITENDHRFAMAFAILGLRQPGIEIDNPECVRKSYPRFWGDLRLVQQHSKNQTIVLTGMRASGKSTLGYILAKQYHARFIDLDVEISKLVGMPIDTYVTKYGWPAFRKVEREVTKKFANIKNAVIATGGGTLIFEENYARFKHYYIIFLNVPLPLLRQRLMNDVNIRPALQSDTVKELATIWKQRKAKYFTIADQIYDSRYPR